MSTDVIVLAAAAADVREAALRYETKREGLGAELVLELDALYDRRAHRSLQFPEISEGAVYFVTDDVPVVLGLLHQHRKPDTWRPRP